MHFSDRRNHQTNKLRATKQTSQLASYARIWPSCSGLFGLCVVDPIPLLTDRHLWPSGCILFLGMHFSPHHRIHREWSIHRYILCRLAAPVPSNGMPSLGSSFHEEKFIPVVRGNSHEESISLNY